MLAFICICCSNSLYNLVSKLCCCCAKATPVYTEYNYTENFMEEPPVSKPLVARNYT